MEIIPCVTLKNYKKKNYSIFSESIPKYIKEGEKLYILDLDGIEKNKPSLCFYQKFSSIYDLWIDCGPRNIGDVVDIFMTGATGVTIRRTLSSSLNITDIRDISENKVYLNIDGSDFKNFKSDSSFLKDFDGFVNFKNKEEIEQDIEFDNYKNEIQMLNKIYFYENNANNKSFWEGLGAKGLLVDIDKLKEFKNGI